jgi:hypothetical protein
MYTNCHSSIGAMILLLCPTPFGLAVAIASHHVTDHVAERDYPKGKTNLIEGLFLLAMPIVVLVSSAIHNWELGYKGILFYALTKYMVVFSGALGANIIDLYDKIRSRVLGKREVSWCHNNLPYYLEPKDYKATLRHGYILFGLFSALCIGIKYNPSFSEALLISGIAFSLSLLSVCWFSFIKK